MIVLPSPIINEIIYGRKVGYKIRKIRLNKQIEKISGTKIRKRTFKYGKRNSN